jgi:hypothetical protein
VLPRPQGRRRTRSPPRGSRAWKGHHRWPLLDRPRSFPPPLGRRILRYLAVVNLGPYTYSRARRQGRTASAPPSLASVGHVMTSTLSIRQALRGSRTTCPVTPFGCCYSLASRPAGTTRWWRARPAPHSLGPGDTGVAPAPYARQAPLTGSPNTCSPPRNSCPWPREIG